MTQHSELGASICNRWWNCPGSVRLSRGYENRSSPDARKGTAAHAIAEQCLKTGADASIHVNSALVVDGEDITITAEMADDVQVYLDDCRSVPAGAETSVEVQFDLFHLKPPAPMFGTADFVAYSPTLKKLWVKDYKNGYMHVPATSPQLKYYAIGAALWLGPKKVVTEVEVTVCQPNGSGEAVRSVTYAIPELVTWARELMDHSREAMKPDAPLQAGAWCRFCPARVDCPARAKEALAVAQIEFAGDVSVLDTPMLPEIRLLTTAELGVIKSRAAMLESWLNDADAELLRRGLAGEELRDWKVVAKRPVRSWKNEEEAATAIRNLGADPYSTEVISPAKAEALVAENTPGKTKKARLEEAKKRLSTFTQSISSGATLAPAADPRPALPAPGGEFTALPDETEKS